MPNILKIKRSFVGWEEYPIPSMLFGGGDC